MKTQIIILMLSLALLSLAASAGATVIYVSGDQTGTWSADTVIVTAEVRVPPGQSLTILPGVEVLFSVYCKFIVDSAATLRAVGTPADSIRFDALPPNTTWHGIRFLSASNSSRLEYCHLTHGHATGSEEDNKGGAIYCSGTSPNIEHGLIQSCSATYGGAIYCTETNPNINCNTVSGNSGGGIYCHYSNPTISGNTISENGGGGIHCDNSSPVIAGNNISQNGTGYCGGGIRCLNNSNPNIHSNTIIGNSALSAIMYAFGGGIYSANSSPIIRGNIIQGNVAQGDEMGGYGGGIYCSGSNAIIELNEISHNLAAAWDGLGYGGGAYLSEGATWFNKNSVVYNSASWGAGGGLYCSSMIPDIINCIFWGNSLPQISGSGSVAYSNIQDGWAGIGNINADPLFINAAQNDYRLQWDSPCIDSGNPNPFYNDPDGTRADMGACYYDQSLPVRILLTPYNAPIQIPAAGGGFQYAIQATNIESATLSALLWCNITFPSGTTSGPVLGPVTISLGSGQTISRLRTQNIPARAPAGLYHYNAYVVAAGDTSEDSFTFVKLGAGVWDLGSGGWTNMGESFEGQEEAVLIHLSSFRLHPPHPNPFNPSTVASFELRVPSHVSLRVYDTAGRLVRTLVDGWRPAGKHQAVFDGSGLPSGIYLAHLTAGDFSAVQKLILLK